MMMRIVESGILSSKAESRARGLDYGIGTTALVEKSAAHESAKIFGVAPAVPAVCSRGPGPRTSARVGKGDWDDPTVSEPDRAIFGKLCVVTAPRRVRTGTVRRFFRSYVAKLRHWIVAIGQGHPRPRPFDQIEPGLLWRASLGRIAPRNGPD